MALVFMDGFDLTNGTSFRNWLISQQGSSTAYVGGALGGSAFRLQAGTANNDNISFYRVLPSTYSQLVWGVRFYTSSTVQSDIFKFRTSGGTTVGSLRINSATGNLSVYNAASTLVATGFRNAMNAYHYLEFRIFVNGASGECEVYLDGTLEIATTVSNFGSTNIGQIMSTLTQSGGQLYLDDVYVLDTTGGAPLNTFLGDSHIETLLPTSDGANTDWTPNSGGTEYTQVDDNPYDGDTTYIYDNTPGNISTFGCADLSFASGTVYAVQPNLMARKDDSGLREIRPVIRQGGVDYSVGTVVAPAVSYLLYTDILPLDPVGATWTAANVNANEYGVELVT
jgi:hypothetical protein